MHNSSGGARRKTRVYPSGPAKEEEVVTIDKPDYAQSSSSSPIATLVLFSWVGLLTVLFVLYALMHVSTEAQQVALPQKRNSVKRHFSFNITSTSPKFMETQIPFMIGTVLKFSVCCEDELTFACNSASGVVIRLIRPDIARIQINSAREAQCVVLWTMRQKQKEVDV